MQSINDGKTSSFGEMYHMKIAFVYDCIYPFVKGGAEKRIFEIGRRLSIKGHQIHLFGIKWWGNEEILLKDGMVIHGVCKPRSLYTKQGRRSISEAIIFTLSIFNPLQKEDFDIIDVSNFPYFPTFISKFVCNIRTSTHVITWHEVWNDYWYEYMGRMGICGKIIEYITSKLAMYHVAVSPFTKDRLISLGVNNNKISIIPNGIDIEQIRQVQPAENGCDVLFAGRLIKDKNVDILIKSLALLKEQKFEITCKIIGDGPEKNKLINMTKYLNLQSNIKFLGFLSSYEDMISIMKSSKVFVLPSTREGFGIVVIEANACGVPVITVRDEMNAAATLIVDRETGFLVNLDEREIADRLKELLLNDKLRESLSSKCINYSENYNWNKIADSIEKLYIDIISNKR